MAQFNTGNNAFQAANKTLFEVNQIATTNGELVSNTNPFAIRMPEVSLSGKGRIRTTSKTVIFHNTSQYNTGPDFWDHTTTLGATHTYDSNKNATVMTSSSTTDSEAVRQTKIVMPYIPGRTIEALLSFQVTQATGARTRVGLFDTSNGVYFEKDENNIFWCVLRSSASGSVVENRVARTDWNGDKLDGTGESGITVPPGQIQLVCFEYEWFGSGAVHLSFLIDGAKRIIHTFYTANRSALPWSTTPFLPFRMEVKNISSATTSYLTLYSTSYSLEAESVGLGTPKTHSLAGSGVTLTTAFTYYPVISMRLRSTQLGAVAFMEQIQAFTSDNSFLLFKVLRNATLTGGTWTNHDTDTSAIEVSTDVSAFTGGELVSEGIVPLNGVPYSLDGTTAFQIGRSSMGTVSDVYTLVLAPSKNNSVALASIRWREQR